jgi:hypothetical protein
LWRKLPVVAQDYQLWRKLPVVAQASSCGASFQLWRKLPVLAQASSFGASWQPALIDFQRHLATW